MKLCNFCCDILQITGTGDIGVRRQLAGGGEELFLGKGGLEEYGTHPQQGGGGPAGVRLLFKGRGTGGASLRIGDLGGQPLHGQVPEGVSDPGVETSYRTASTEDTVREVDMAFSSPRRSLFLHAL